MISRFGTFPLGLVIFAVMVFAGCTPPAVTTPSLASDPSGGAGMSGSPGERDMRAGGRDAAQVGPGRAGEAARAGRSIREEGSATPSLEALRRGQAPTTPETSPLKEIYFDFDRYTVRADARETLKGNADWLRRNPAARVIVEGHCDERGTNEYNLALGAKRAQAAKDYLMTLGIAPERLSTISYGEEVPVCTEKTEECWQRNRRARFVIAPAPPTS